MPIYVVQARGRDQSALERARFVAEAFSWPAFLLTGFWLLFHRLWLALAGWIVFDLVFFLALAPNLTGGATVAAYLAAKLFVGFEGHRFRVAKAARTAELTDVLAARDRDEAEMAFFHRQTAVEGANTTAEAVGAPA